MTNLYLRKLALSSAILAGIALNMAADEVFPEYNVTPGDVVKEQPAGELKTFVRDGIDYRAYLGGVEMGYQTGMELKVVFGEDGKTVWFYNLISTAQDCFSWVEGTLEDGIVTIKEGTPMWCYDYQTYITAYILCNLKENPEGKEGTTDAFECMPGDIHFAYEDGNFKLLPNDSGVAAIGLQRYSTDSFIIEYGWNYKWLGYADQDSFYTPFNDVPNAGPSENAEIKTYAFSAKYAPWSETETFLVDLAFDDTKLYLRGIGGGLGDEYWAEAGFDGEKATFPSKQFLGGVKEGFETFMTYLCAAKILDDEYVDFADDAVFVYSAEDDTFSSDGALMLNVGEGSVQPVVFWTEMSMVPYVEAPAVPANPIIIEGYTENPYFEGCGSITVEIPCESVGGTYILPDNLSYMIYIDGEPFTFEPDTYFAFGEPMTEIPYYFVDWYDIYPESESVRTINFYGDKPESIGVQSICTVDGIVNKSEIVYALSTGIDTMDGIREIKSVNYYSLDGKQVNEQFKGIVIREEIYGDGVIKKSKIINR